MRAWWLLLVLGLGCGPRAVRAPTAVALGPAQELHLGHQVAAELADQGAVPGPVELQDTLAALVAVAPPGWRRLDWGVVVLPDDSGLYGTPSGTLAVGADLMAVWPDGAAGPLLAHAMAHVILRHGVQRVQTGVLLQLAAGSPTLDEPAGRSALLGALGFAARVGGSEPWSRGHEAEADELAGAMLARAGLESAGPIWASLRSGAPVAMLREHPCPPSRLRRLRAAGGALPLAPEAAE